MKKCIVFHFLDIQNTLNVRLERRVIFIYRGPGALPVFSGDKK